jgi:hypothetical protein
MDVVKSIFRSDGVLGFYAGMESTFWRYVPAVSSATTPDVFQDTSGGMEDTSVPSTKSRLFSPNPRYVVRRI